MNTYDEEEILIYEGEIQGNRIRYYVVEDGLQSATFVEEGKHFDLLFPYMEKFNEAFNLRKNLKNILLIGGAGYSYPKHVIHHYRDVSMDVVDSDESAEEMALDYFYLDELYEKYGHDRLWTIVEEGRTYLKKTDTKYDVIINDAFIGQVPSKELLTLEALESIKKCLKEEGIYIANVPDYEEEYFLPMIQSTTKKVFKNVVIISAKIKDHLFETNNCVLFASDGPLYLENALEIPYTSNLFLDENIEEYF